MEESIYILRLSVLAKGIFHGCLSKVTPTTVANREQTICIGMKGKLLAGYNSGAIFAKDIYRSPGKDDYTTVRIEDEVMSGLHEQDINLKNLIDMFNCFKTIETKFNDELTAVSIVGEPYFLFTNINLPVDVVNGEPRPTNRINIRVVTWNIEEEKDVVQMLSFDFDKTLNQDWATATVTITEMINDFVNGVVGKK